MSQLLGLPDDLVLLVGGYVFLLASSGLIVGIVLALIPDTEATGDGEGADEPTDSGGGSGGISRLDRDVGTVIGKCENVLVLTFVLLGAYTGLAIIFAAKGIVRREDIRNNTRYYLAGTLVNFTYSIAVSAFVLYVDQLGQAAEAGSALLVGTGVSLLLVGVTAVRNR